MLEGVDMRGLFRCGHGVGHVVTVSLTTPAPTVARATEGEQEGLKPVLSCMPAPTDIQSSSACCAWVGVSGVFDGHMPYVRGISFGSGALSGAINVAMSVALSGAQLWIDVGEGLGWVGSGWVGSVCGWEELA